MLRRKGRTERPAHWAIRENQTHRCQGGWGMKRVRRRRESQSPAGSSIRDGWKKPLKFDRWCLCVISAQERQHRPTLVQLPTSAPWSALPAGTSSRVYNIRALLSIAPRLAESILSAYLLSNWMKELLEDQARCNLFWWENWAQAPSHKIHPKCLPEILLLHRAVPCGHRLFCAVTSKSWPKWWLILECIFTIFVAPKNCPLLNEW